MRRLLGLFLLGSCVAAAPARADETTFCNAFITSLPYTITTQGHYCLDRNLSTAITTGAAITIAADFVVLDLDNFKLGGGAAGPGTEAIGVFSADHSNITVRNGNIRGFDQGILLTALSGGTPQNLRVEGNVVDGNQSLGIGVYAGNYSVRGNTVANTFGIAIQASPHGEVIGNTVYGTADGAGIAADGIVEGNRLLGTAAGAASYIGWLCRDNVSLHGGPAQCEAYAGSNVATP